MMPLFTVMTFLKLGDDVSHQGDEIPTHRNDIPLLSDDVSEVIALYLIKTLFACRFTCLVLAFLGWMTTFLTL